MGDFDLVFRGLGILWFKRNEWMKFDKSFPQDRLVFSNLYNSPKNWK
ncbi:hypothetical protein C943_03748 [Mariniradius saccharolyticus AK6]|uniref:Uncharacterized protein n=1 Tax=Mariniradius saccharolyticus AK6 TaxID=1239962 RepID=M7XI74_9BACT|nr:hypothetical protein C943_03748 [Mariniradius saccharolyticus AK6]